MPEVIKESKASNSSLPSVYESDGRDHPQIVVAGFQNDPSSTHNQFFVVRECMEAACFALRDHALKAKLFYPGEQLRAIMMRGNVAEAWERGRDNKVFEVALASNQRPGTKSSPSK